MGKKKKDRFKSKYLDLDFENMSDEEFDKISKEVYKDIGVRCGGGVVILIFGLIAIVLGGMYLW